MSPSCENKKWIILERAPSEFLQEHKELPSILAHLLWQRNIRQRLEIEQFLNPSLNNLHDPFLFRHMKLACERIMTAIKNEEKIVIHGDYDADGIGGATILYETLREIGGKPEVFFPKRIRDGYGIAQHSAETFVSEGIQLVITCDCGIANINEIAYLKTHGVDVIITDHHQFKEIIPSAYAILHPLIPDESYPDKTLAGGGVAFKLAQGLLRLQSNATLEKESQLLDIAAISTVADMVPLRGESRVIVFYGLLQMSVSERYGIQSIVSKIKDCSTIDATTIAFHIAPRINAPGRLGDARPGFNLLTSHSSEEAEILYKEIDAINKERRSITAKAVKEAEQQIELEIQSGKNILFAYSKNWPLGIVGLIAGKLAEKYGMPALVMTDRNEEIAGSGRSFGGINLIEQLNTVASYLRVYGGHPQACGFSLKSPELLPYFEKALEESMQTNIQNPDSQGTCVDLYMQLEDITWENFRAISKLQPFGMSNREPICMCQNVILDEARMIGSTDTTVTMKVRNNAGLQQKFIGFQKSNYLRSFHLGDRVDILFQQTRNTWNGRDELQCRLIDMRHSHE